MRRYLQWFSGLVPFELAFLLCDGTWAAYLRMLVGGLVFWIPYWAGWWLIFFIAARDGWEWAVYTRGFAWSGMTPEPVSHQYRMGPQGYGLYIGETKVA